MRLIAVCLLLIPIIEFFLRRSELIRPIVTRFGCCRRGRYGPLESPTSYPYIISAIVASLLLSTIAIFAMSPRILLALAVLVFCRSAFCHKKRLVFHLNLRRVSTYGDQTLGWHRPYPRLCQPRVSTRESK
jgi:hypothetical protein